MSDHTAEVEQVPAVKLPPRRLPIGGILMLGGGLMGLAAATVFYLGYNREGVRADVAEEKVEEVVSATGPVCERPALDSELTRLCAAAESAKQLELPPPLPGEEVDYDLVRSMVAGALEADPRLSEQALMGMLNAVYAANPPKDGETPTQDQLLALIRQVYSENPPDPGEDGEDGAAGADGRNAFCFDNPDDPSCQPRQGAQGVSVVGFGFERTEDGSCVLAEVLENPATGERQTLRLPAPEEFCGPPPPTEEPGLPGG